MLLEKLVLRNFRNIENLELSFNDELNFFAGKNGQGKTNLLEAVYLCCVGKSPFHKEKDLILTRADEAYVCLFGKKREGNFKIEVFLNRSEKKKFYLNGLVLNKASDILGCLNAVFFSPDSLKLIKEAPLDRRKFLDIDLSQLYKSYCAALLKYNKILQQRNNLLKNYQLSAVEELLSVWDMQLVKEGSFLIKKRCEFIDELSVYAVKAHSFLSSGTEKLEVSYLTDIELTDIEFSFYNLLKANLKKDFALKHTSIGPHRDDLKINLNGTDVKTFSSQGQQRTVALSLKLAEIHYFKEITGEYPILLLDDVFSELDAIRQNNLLVYISDTQSFLTGTSLENPLSFGNFSFFLTDAGTFKKVN